MASSDPFSSALTNEGKVSREWRHLHQEVAGWKVEEGQRRESEHREVTGVEQQANCRMQAESAYVAEEPGQSPVSESWVYEHGESGTDDLSIGVEWVQDEEEIGTEDSTPGLKQFQDHEEIGPEDSTLSFDKFQNQGEIGTEDITPGLKQFQDHEDIDLGDLSIPGFDKFQDHEEIGTEDSTPGSGQVQDQTEPSKEHPTLGLEQAQEQGEASTKSSLFNSDRHDEYELTGDAKTPLFQSAPKVDLNHDVTCQKQRQPPSGKTVKGPAKLGLMGQIQSERHYFEQKARNQKGNRIQVTCLKPGMRSTASSAHAESRDIEPRYIGDPNAEKRTSAVKHVTTFRPNNMTRYFEMEKGPGKRPVMVRPIGRVKEHNSSKKQSAKSAK